MHPSRSRLPRPARRRREEMEHLPASNRRLESKSQEAGPVEYVLAKESFQGGRWVLESRVWADGGVSRKE